MSKLFTKEDQVEDVTPGRLTRNGVEIMLEDLNLDEVHEDHTSYMELATEHLSNLQFQMYVASNLKSEFQSHQVGSSSYNLGLESRTSMVKELASNLGVKVHVASMEDFTGEYTAKDSHEVTMEGIKGFFKRIWEAIKKFFSSFWKKVSNFFKRLVGANLDIDTYEKYIPEMIRRIKKDKLECKDKSEIVTKLPGFVSPLNFESPEASALISNYKLTSGNLHRAFSKILIPTLDRIRSSDGGLGSVKRAILDFRKKVIDGSMTVEEATTYLTAITDGTNSLVRALAANSPTSHNSVPGEVLDKFQDTLSGGNLNKSLYSLIDSNVDGSRLPKYFNIYVYSPDMGEDLVEKFKGVKTPSEVTAIVKELYSTGVATYLSEEIVRTDRVNPLDTIELVDSFWTSYKDFKIDISKLDEVTKSSEKIVDEVIKTAQQSLGDTDGILKQRSRVTGGPIREKLISKIRACTNREVLLGLMESLTSASVPFDRSVIIQIQDLDEGGVEITMDLLVNPLVGYIEDTNVDNELLAGINTYLDENDHVMSSVDLSEEIEKEIDIKGVLVAYEQAIIRTLDTYKSILGSVITDLAKLQTEFRYEAIKYIYDSCRKYG